MIWRDGFSFSKLSFASQRWGLGMRLKIPLYILIQYPLHGPLHSRNACMATCAAASTCNQSQHISHDIFGSSMTNLVATFYDSILSQPSLDSWLLDSTETIYYNIYETLLTCDSEHTHTHTHTHTSTKISSTKCNQYYHNEFLAHTRIKMYCITYTCIILLCLDVR